MGPADAASTGTASGPTATTKSQSTTSDLRGDNQDDSSTPLAYDKSDWVINREVFNYYNQLYGPFTLDACADNDGRNAHCKKFCSPNKSIFETNVAGENSWFNPPWDQIEATALPQVQEESTRHDVCSVHTPRCAQRTLVGAALPDEDHRKISGEVAALHRSAEGTRRPASRPGSYSVAGGGVPRRDKAAARERRCQLWARKAHNRHTCTRCYLHDRLCAFILRIVLQAVHARRAHLRQGCAHYNRLRSNAKCCGHKICATLWSTDHAIPAEHRATR